MSDSRNGNGFFGVILFFEIETMAMLIFNYKKNVILLFPKIIHFQDMFSQAFPVSDTNGQLNCVM